MKKYSKYLMILAAAVLAACSSMEVDEDEIARENFPADFSVVDYMELHPALIVVQVKDSVVSYNNASGLDSAAKIEDFDKFKADTASVHKIFVDPLLMAKTEQEWATVWVDIVDTVMVYDSTRTYDTVKVSFNDGGKAVNLYKLTKIVTDSTGIISATGYMEADTATMENEVTYTVSETVKFEKKGMKVDTVVVKIDTTTTTKVIPGSLTSVETDLKKFNMFGIPNDYETLSNIAKNPDTVAIKMQYIIYGKNAGWAYRKCKESELGNTELTSVKEVKLGATYCDDNGLVREIK